MRLLHIIVALANPSLRERLVGTLQAQGFTPETPRDLEDLRRDLEEAGADDDPEPSRVLLLDEAFIYPHVYEECSGIKAAAQVPLTIILLVEPRTRTRWDWNGVDHVLRLPMNVEEIAGRAVGSRAAQNCRSYIQDETAP